MKQILNNTTNNYVHVNREIGGLAIGQINQESDEWTIAKVTQIISSSNTEVANIVFSQINKSLTRPDDEIPLSDVLSVFKTNGLYACRFYNKAANM